MTSHKKISAIAGSAIIAGSFLLTSCSGSVVQTPSNTTTENTSTNQSNNNSITKNASQNQTTSVQYDTKSKAS